MTSYIMYTLTRQNVYVLIIYITGKLSSNSDNINITELAGSTLSSQFCYMILEQQACWLFQHTSYICMSLTLYTIIYSLQFNHDWFTVLLLNPAKVSSDKKCDAIKKTQQYSTYFSLFWQILNFNLILSVWARRGWFLFICVLCCLVLMAILS